MKIIMLCILLKGFAFNCIVDNELLANCAYTFLKKETGFQEANEISLNFPKNIMGSKDDKPQKIVLNNKVFLVKYNSKITPSINFWGIRESHKGTNYFLIDFTAVSSGGSKMSGSFCIQFIEGKAEVESVNYVKAID